LIFGVFVLVAGVIVTRWVRQSAGRLSVVVAPLVLLGGFVLVPQVTDPCAPATTTIPSATTTVPSATTTTVAPTTTTTTTTTTTLAPVVGGAGPSGGIVFYDAGSVQSWGRYLEVACAGWSDGTCGGDLTDPRATWGCSGTSITGADGTAIGTGGQNTTDITAIVDGCQTSGIAARLANDLTLGGQSDWFLPSRDELNALCKWAFNDTANAICNNNGSGGLSLMGVGGFSTDYYWSSSESSSVNFPGLFAGGQNFVGGDQNNGGKTNLYSVRPVRAF
jgi:hypothetical protein